MKSIGLLQIGASILDLFDIAQLLDTREDFTLTSYHAFHPEAHPHLVHLYTDNWEALIQHCDVLMVSTDAHLNNDLVPLFNLCIQYQKPIVWVLEYIPTHAILKTIAERLHEAQLPCMIVIKSNIDCDSLFHQYPQQDIFFIHTRLHWSAIDCRQLIDTASFLTHYFFQQHNAFDAQAILHSNHYSTPSNVQFLNLNLSIHGQFRYQLFYTQAHKEKSFSITCIGQQSSCCLDAVVVPETTFNTIQKFILQHNETTEHLINTHNFVSYLTSFLNTHNPHVPLSTLFHLCQIKDTIQQQILFKAK